MKTIIRLVLSFLTALFIVLGIFTAETVTDELGWTAVVRAFVSGGWSAMIDAGYSDWIWAGALFSAGMAVALWADFFVRKLSPRRLSARIDKVHGRKYRHEKVIVDGKTFTGCEFEGVTFEYLGVGYFGFEECKFRPGFTISIKNEYAAGTFGLVKLAQDSGVPLKLLDFEPE